MRRLTGILAIILLPVLAVAASQEEAPLKQDGEYLPPAHFLNPDGEAGTEVLLVGTWHFAYPGLDAHVAEEDKRVDVLSDQRQAEMVKLLDYLARFEPDAIALECDKDSDFAESYRQFRSGELEDKRDERYQIGFRLARRMGLDEIHCVDAESFATDHMDKLKAMEAVPEAYDFKSDDEMSRRYKRWYDYKDRVAKDATLLEGLLYTNREDVLDRGFGAYLVGDFKLGDHGGADALALHWYNRNLRIFRNIQQLDEQGYERILTLFGSGHVQILKRLVDSSPEFERVPFGNL